MNARDWWNGLEPRERRTLTVGGVALAVILFVFVIWLPAHRGAAAAEQRLADQRALLAWMEQAAAEVRALQAGGGDVQSLGGQNLFSFVDKSARDSGLGKAIRQVEPTPDQRVRVSLAGASFDTVMRWLATLGSRYGIEVSQLSVRRAEAPGTADFQLILEGPPQ